MLTNDYGFITDYVAEAFHHMFKHSNRYAYVKNHLKLGKAVVGRDETAVCKTIAGFLKLLHPGNDPTDEEFEEYLEYALEGRRRVKEQLNKRKSDDEFSEIEFSYFNTAGVEKFVSCLESADLPKTLEVPQIETPTKLPHPAGPTPLTSIGNSTDLIEKHFTIRYEAIGYSYESIFGSYLNGAKTVIVEDPYIRSKHQFQNFSRFCELAIKAGSVREIKLTTGAEDSYQEVEASSWLENLAKDLLPYDIKFTFEFDPNIHDREIRCDNGWIIKIGRGFDIYLKPEDNFTGLGRTEFDLRPCRETKVDIYKSTNE